MKRLILLCLVIQSACAMHKPQDNAFLMSVQTLAALGSNNQHKVRQALEHDLAVLQKKYEQEKIIISSHVIQTAEDARMAREALGSLHESYVARLRVVRDKNIPFYKVQSNFAEPDSQALFYAKGSVALMVGLLVFCSALSCNNARGMAVGLLLLSLSSGVYGLNTLLKGQPRRYCKYVDDWKESQKQIKLMLEQFKMQIDVQIHDAEIEGNKNV